MVDRSRPAPDAKARMDLVFQAEELLLADAYAARCTSPSATPAERRPGGRAARLPSPDPDFIYAYFTK